MRTLTFYAVALALVLGSALDRPASAEECRSTAGVKAPAGTLASPAAPCPPATRKPAPPPRDAAKKPSTFQDDGTSFYFGGSFGTTIGGRR